jgi:hypothetical protein
MHDRALFNSMRGSRLPIVLGLSVLAAGCSTDGVEPEKRPPATKHLKYIEDLQKKAVPTKEAPAKGH